MTLGAIAGAGTLYGALTSGRNAAATLLPVLSLPAFAPLLIAGERVLQLALHGGALLGGGSSRSWPWPSYLALGILLYGVLEES